MRYYIINARTKRIVRVCEGLTEVKEYFGTAYLREDKIARGSYYDDLALSENDTRAVYVGSYEYPNKVFVFRTTMVVDEYGRTIDPRVYEDVSPAGEREKAEEKVWAGYRYIKTSEIKFRGGPVPGLRRSKCHRGTIYRHPRTTREIRQSCDPELKEYVRGSRGKNLPDVYDDIVRSRSRCWKEKKVPRQWAKHMTMGEARLAMQRKHSEIQGDSGYVKGDGGF